MKSTTEMLELIGRWAERGCASGSGSGGGLTGWVSPV